MDTSFIVPILYHIIYIVSSVKLHKYECKCLVVLYIEKDVKSIDFTPITMYNIDTMKETEDSTNKPS